MLPILLSILKIAGIVLLVLLGLICLVLFTVLMVPVRYRLSGSYDKELQVSCRITWLLHAISVTLTYEKELNVTVRILGRKRFGEKGRYVPADSGEEADESLAKPPDEWEDLEDVLEQDDLSDEYEPDDDEVKPQEERKKQTSFSEKKPRPTLDSVKARWSRLKEQKEKLEAFLNDERNQQTFKLFRRQLKKLIRHLLPTRVQGKAVIGFEDPATTGRVLAGLSILYAWYGDNLEITPVFDESVLEAEGSMKGRIRTGTVLLVCARMLLNKNFRILLRKIRRSGGK